MSIIRLVLLQKIFPKIVIFFVLNLQILILVTNKITCIKSFWNWNEDWNYLFQKHLLLFHITTIDYALWKKKKMSNLYSLYY